MHLWHTQACKKINAWKCFNLFSCMCMCRLMAKGQKQSLCLLRNPLPLPCLLLPKQTERAKTRNGGNASRNYTSLWRSKCFYTSFLLLNFPESFHIRKQGQKIPSFNFFSSTSIVIPLFLNTRHIFLGRHLAKFVLSKAGRHWSNVGQCSAM